MKYIIMQPWGIGDILYITPLIKALNEQNEVIWPVKKEFLWIKDYIDLNFIEYYDGVYDNYPLYTQIPTMYTDELMKHEGNFNYIMSSKYEYFGYDSSNWLQLKWKRNISKELKLAEDLGVDIKNDNYIIVNKHCGFPPHTANYINPLTDNKIIYLELIDNYTLLDWGLLLENAKEIHTVNTSILMVLGILNPNIPIHVYPYVGHKDLTIIDDILNYFPKWNKYSL